MRLSIALLILLFCSCNDKNEEAPIFLKTSNYHLSDLGQTNVKKDFTMSIVGNKTHFSFKTKVIKKNDTINDLLLEKNNAKLTFKLNTTPNDFDCMSDSCFTAHEVSFLMDTILPQGFYNIEIYINYGLSGEDSFTHKFDY